MSAGQATTVAGQTAELTTLLGTPVFARGDTDGAIAKADAVLAADPRNVDLILAAARARDVALQFHSAIEVYTRGLAIAPDDVRLWRFRGHRYISIRRFDLAVPDLEHAVRLAPSSFDATYQGAISEAKVLEPVTPRENRLVTVGDGVANFHLANGDREHGCRLLREIVAAPNWNAFGVIAAEADLARPSGPCS